MSFIVGKSRNPTLNMAWSAFKKEQRAEKKAKAEAPAEPPVPAKKAKKARSK
jgi:hypothetical protein